MSERLICSETWIQILKVQDLPILTPESSGFRDDIHPEKITKLVKIAKEGDKKESEEEKPDPKRDNDEEK